MTEHQSFWLTGPTLRGWIFNFNLTINPAYLRHALRGAKSFDPLTNLTGLDFQYLKERYPISLRHALRGAKSFDTIDQPYGVGFF